MNQIILGSHVNMCAPDYLVGSVNQAISYGANCLMIYTGAPHNVQRADLSKLNVNAFHQILKQHHIPLEHVIVHGPYIVNLGASNPQRFDHSVTFLKNEIRRTSYIGAKYFVLHPGNATDDCVEQAIKNIANGINRINETNDDVVICLETMSGKGKEIGNDFMQLAQIIKQIKTPHKIGVCLDTCHLHDAGYDVGALDQLLDEFDQIVGLEYVKVIHLNDSKNQQGANKDRHENIGYGKIGFAKLLK
jgi:deoxyribonuclease-4